MMLEGASDEDLHFVSKASVSVARPVMSRSESKSTRHVSIRHNDS